MSFIVRNPNAVAFILADDELYYEFAASENSIDLEAIFSWEKLNRSSQTGGALYTAINNGDLIRRNATDTADIPIADAFDDAIWLWSVSKEQSEALSGSFGTPSATNPFVTYNDPVLFTGNLVKVELVPRPGEFATIAAAMASITTAALGNDWVILVGPGLYIEDTITVKPFVTVQGSGIGTIVAVNNPDKDLFVMSASSRVSGLALTGASGVGKALIRVNSVMDVLITSIFFGNAYHFIVCESITASALVVLENGLIRPASIFNEGFRCTSSGGFSSVMFLHGVDGKSQTTATSLFHAAGPEADLSLADVVFRVEGAGNITNGIFLENGSSSFCSSITLHSFDNGLVVANAGSGPKLTMSNLSIAESTVQDVIIANPGTTGVVTGVWRNNFVTKDPAAQVSLTAADPNNSFYVNQAEVDTRDVNVVHVRKNPGPNDFTSVKAAVDSITTASVSNQYLINIGPGTFIEDTIQMKEYVSIAGLDRSTTIIEVDDPGKFLFRSSRRSSVSRLTMRGGTLASGGIVLGVDGSFGTFVLREVTFGSGYSVVNLTTSTFCQVTLFNCVSDIGVTWTKPFIVSHPTGENILNILDMSFQLDNPCDDFLYVSGPQSEVDISVISGLVAAEFGGSMLSAIRINDGGIFRCGLFTIIDPDNGLIVENTGAGPDISISNFVMTSTTGFSINVMHPGTTGFITGNFIASQVFIDEAAALAVSFSDPTSTVGFTVVGQLWQGDTHGKIANVTELLRQTTTLGLILGGNLTLGGGLDLNVSAGTGFIHDGDGTVREVAWANATITLLPLDDVYIIVDSDGVISTSASYTELTNIVLGRVVANSTAVAFIDASPIDMKHTSNAAEDFFRTALGPVYASGSVVTETVGTPFALDVASGSYYFGTVKFLPVGGINITWTSFHSDGLGGWVSVPAQTLVTQQYDDGSGILASIPLGGYAKHALYISGDGLDEKYAIVFAQTTYATLVEVEDAALPTPPSFLKDGVTRIASIVVQEGTLAITQIRDERPRIGFTASGVSASASHGNLLGLGNNDHPQYLLRDGSAPMTGSLNLGGNSITNVNQVDGVDISTHAARHLPNGADPLTTAVAFSIGANNVAAIGSANAFSRSDHIHAITTGVTLTLLPDQVNAAGTGNALARADHIHNIPTSIVVAIGSANAQGVAASFARADHVHEGVHGVRSNVAVYHFGDITLQNGPGITITDAGAGVFSFSTPSAIDAAVFSVTYPGTGLSVNYTGGNIRFNDAFLTVASGSLLLPASEAGEIYVNPAGTVLATIGSTNTPADYYPIAGYTTSATAVTLLTDRRVWVNKNYIWGIAANITSILPDDVVSAGTIDRYARADHRHAISTTAPIAPLSATTTDAEGVATSFARGDHSHAILTGIVSALTPDLANAAGTSPNLSRADHIHNIPTATAVGLDAASTSTQGVALTFARSDHTHAISTGIVGDITTILPDATGSAGVLNSFARADHRHAIAAAAPTTPLSATTADAEGAGTAFSRNDHTHSILTGVVSAQTPDQISAAGTSPNLARADHVHNIATASAVGLDAISVNSQGAASTFARSNHTHAIASGVVLTQVADQANAAGTSSNFARADHIHNIPTAIVVSIGAANAIGSSTSFARADHVHQGVHAIRENAGAFRFNNISLVNGSGVSIADDGAGNFTFNAATLVLTELYVTYPGSGLSVNYTAGKVRFNGTFTNVSPGSLLLTASSSGEIYVDTDGVVKSAATVPSAAVGIAAFTTDSGSVLVLADRRVWVNPNDTWGLVAAVTSILPNDAASAGAQNTSARTDHRHAIATTAPITPLSATTTDAEGVASSFARGDHTHSILTGVVSTLTPDQVNAAGTSPNLSRADHIHNIPTATAVGLSAASTNTQGLAANFARSDHTHAIGTALVAEITTILPDDAASAGTSNNFARGDHRHAIAAAAPAANLTAVTTNTEGVATSFSRSDHSHAITTGAASALTPDQANATGISASLARADHIHNIATAAAVTISSNANAQGAAASFARSDHTHQLTTTAALLDHVPQWNGSAWVNTYPEVLPNPDRATFFREDFTTGSIASTNFGSHSWFAVINGGGSTITNGSSLTTGNHPGVILITSGNAANRYATLTLLNTFLLGGGPMEIGVLFQISTITQDNFRIGLGDLTSNADFQNGVYLEFNSGTSANWLIKTASGGTRTSQTTTTAAVPLTWQKLIISINAAATAVSYTLNGASLGTIITNIPTTNLVGPALISNSLGGTASTLGVDYYMLTQRFTTPR